MEKQHESRTPSEHVVEVDSRKFVMEEHVLFSGSEASSEYEEITVHSDEDDAVEDIYKWESSCALSSIAPSGRTDASSLPWDDDEKEETDDNDTGQLPNTRSEDLELARLVVGSLDEDSL